MKDKVTLGIFAHANAGKTTITEHLLYHTGVINDIGRVDSGNTVTDDMSLEKERGITVRDSLVSFDLSNKTIELIDTPGHVDFRAEVEKAINVLDCAILSISGVEGLESGTYTIWRALKEKNVPVVIFINKMDRLGADYNKVINDLKTDLEIPTVTLSKVIKNDNELIIEYPRKEELIEELSTVSDELLNKYINNEIISNEYLNDLIKELISSCKVYPVIGGSALNDIGIKDIIKLLEDFFKIEKEYNNYDPSAYVFNIRVNEKGKNAYIKVLDGSIKLRDNIKIDEDEYGKIKNIYIAKGKDFVSVESVKKGEIAIIPGLDVKQGQVIGNTKNKEKYISFVKPLLDVEIKANNQDESIELMNALKILNAEDEYLNVRFNERTKSIYCSLMGDVQSQIIKSLLKERFEIDASILNPMIIHKETISNSARGKATYTSVSGLELEITPLERGEGFHFVSKLSTDFLHLKYQRQVERLINYYANQGLKGWELTDMEVAIVDGQFDSMGSDPMHFNIITPIALFRALKDANVKLLEPISEFIINTPKEYLSNVVKLLSQKRSNYEITKDNNKTIILSGTSPSEEMMNFPLELSKITSGKGIYSSFVSGYDLSINQDVELPYINRDPRNETTFIINDMAQSMEPLDKTLMKKKKESRSKFQRQQKEKSFNKKR